MKYPGPIMVLLLLGSVATLCAQTATLTGVALDESLRPIADVHVTSGSQGTTTDSNGFYLLKLVADQPVTVRFTYLGREEVLIRDLILTTNETRAYNPVLTPGSLQIDEVAVSAARQEEAGVTTISPSLLQNIPGANAGAENVLKLLPGVSSNNELSTQYAVRGGNYDENLVYINGIEVYRPLLVRSAQQEGLGLVNSAMVRRLKFSAGGFQARYGDKLSSVLDIAYKQPTGFSLEGQGSLLGGALTVETLSDDQRFSSLSGLRYRDNSLFINSTQTQTRVRPLFADLQTYLQYRFSPKFELGFLGTASANRYRNRPVSRQTNFGTLDAPRALLIYYEGQEKHRFSTVMGALKAEYRPTQALKLQLIQSVYHTVEQEFADLIAQYELGPVDTDLAGGDPGQVLAPRGIGASYERRRNILDALIYRIGHGGDYQAGPHRFQWGVDFRVEDFRDQLREAEFIDSAGFFVRPPASPQPPNVPGTPGSVPIVPYESAFSDNDLRNTHLQGYVQYGLQKSGPRADFSWQAGLRWHGWKISGFDLPDVGENRDTRHFILSPRTQVALKPHWERDMLFRLAVGLYQQPPFYRELRDPSGSIHPEVKAQRSWHSVLGHEYSFQIWERPFRLESELYYKYLDRVNPYSLEDIRIRYEAENTAEAWAVGADVRLYGALVPGLESWVSVGYLQTEENRDGRGFIPRPTDQRLKLGILFQDYIPSMPQVRMYLNLVYQTGVPGGSPAHADPYVFQNRLRDYKRADLGISHIFAGRKSAFPENHWLQAFEEFYAGVEIFNLFNNQNSITNTWVRDADSKLEFAVPNYLTPRVLNIKFGFRF